MSALPPAFPNLRSAEPPPWEADAMLFRSILLNSNPFEANAQRIALNERLKPMGLQLTKISPPRQSRPFVIEDDGA